ncbi:hypothetical protein DVH05_019404 [Phytophthora capsici]|nr:hypothetical protein DVH05_019404 [Phytophthora capsici]
MTAPERSTSQADLKVQPSIESGQAFMAKGEAAFHDFVANQLESALGRELPQMEVRWDLTLVAQVPVVHQETQGSTTSLPSV